MAGGFHHVELWVASVESEGPSWGWLLSELGFARSGEWPGGETWSAGTGPYLTLTESPNLASTPHDRRAPGVNHLAFHGGAPAHVDAIMAAAPTNGWRPLYHERYPHAGGPDHYAGWLENAQGYKLEIVADAG